MTHKAKLTVVSATPPHFNPGMHLVDWALDFVLARHGLDVEVDRRLLYLPSELESLQIGAVSDFGLPFPYLLLRQNLEAASESAALLFWGDFLHSRHYRTAVGRLLWRIGAATSLEAGIALVDEHLFLRDAPRSLLDKTLVFGECLLTDDGAGPLDDTYAVLCQRFFAGARRVWLRDALSAARAADLRHWAHGTTLGVDPALLLRPADYDAVAGNRLDAEDRPPELGVFFGRTPVSLDRLLPFVRELGQALDASTIWVPWFTHGANHDLRKSLGFVDDGEGSLARLVAQVRRCRAIVTDAYHLCLTAWNLDVPAVCVGRGATYFRTAVSDKKKELFAGMAGSERLYVFAEQLVDPSASGVTPDQRPLSVAQLARDLDDLTLRAHVRERLDSQRQHAEPDLVNTLRELVTRPTRLAVTPPRGQALLRRARTLLARASAHFLADTAHERVASAEYREVVAIMAVRNEGDIITQTLHKLTSQGIGVYIIDNWSSDGTADQVALFAGRGLVGYERFPAEGPSPYFSLGSLLRRTEQLHLELGARWTIHHDADEVREAAWEGLTYREGLLEAERHGFNCVNHVVVNFRPLDEGYSQGMDFEHRLRHFEWPYLPGHFAQLKAWRTREAVQLHTTGGHCVRFAGQRTCPETFILKHYPIRSRAHGEIKVLQERLPRFDPEERARGWHVHYDSLASTQALRWRVAELAEWTPESRAEVLRRAQAKGVARLRAGAGNADITRQA